MEKKNKNQEKRMFLKKTAIFLVIVFFAWINFSRADLGKYNIFQDKDQDGLSDSEEIAYGTDPDKADTDGDGYSDKVEIESGYDPLKSAPGDKIVSVDETQVLGVESENKEKANLTEKFFEEIKKQESGEAGVFNKILTEGELSDEETESLLTSGGSSIEDVLQKTIEDTTTSKTETTISEEDLNILDKPEGSEEEVKKIEKEQIEKYMSSLVYILAVNKPFDMESTEELPEKISEFIYQISSDVQVGNLKEVRNYKETIETIFTQIKKLEVPFIMVETHISLLAVYQALDEEIDEEKLLSDNDPIAVLLYLGKIQAAFSELEVIQQKIEEILKEYEITSFDPGSVFGVEAE